jgi:hypothetical protein
MLAFLVLHGPTTAPRTQAAARQKPSGKSPISTNYDTSPPVSPAASDDERPWKASRDFFARTQSDDDCLAQASRAKRQGATPPKKENQSNKEDEPQKLRRSRWHIPCTEVVQAMIAVAPDPVHTHMALGFDRAIEAIQLAAGSANYVIDRYWLPWRWSAEASQDDSKSMQIPSGTLAREEQPGLLLFRWNGDSNELRPKVLYVFVVAETATAGINGKQFGNAVDYWQQICSPPSSAQNGCVDSSTIRIMGPTFSGSLASLRRLTDGKNQPHFIAYSGTLSSIDAARNQGLLPESATTSPPNLLLKSFVRDTESGICDFIAWNQGVHRAWEKEERVAIFFEAATSYGGATSKSNGSDGSKDNNNGCNYTTLRYPREISILRNAYQALGSTPPASADKAVSAVNPHLALNLADSTSGSDEPPEFSGTLSPLSKETVLMNIAEELRRRQYRNIGIVGSNTLDVLFLGAFLRKAVPDARLFTFGSDLMFEHGTDIVPYIGTLSVTTYPMIGRNLGWVGASSRNPGRLPFADQYEEGQYNAARRTIIEELFGGQPSQLYEFQRPFPNLSEPSAQPPQWLTVVGNGGYWPVELLTGNMRGVTDGGLLASVPQDKGTALPQLDNRDLAGSWKVMAVLLSALAYLHIVIVLTAGPFTPRFRDFAFVSPAPGQRLFFIQLGAASLALTLAMLELPAYKFAGRSQLIAQFLMAFAIAGLILASVALWINYVWRRRWEQKSSDSVSPASLCTIICEAGAPVLVWVLTLGLFCCWRSLFSSDASLYGFFLAYRSVHLATGVSPFTPIMILMAAIYLWSFFELRRLRFNDQFRPRLTLPTPVDESGRPRKNLTQDENIALAINKFFLSKSYIICLFLALAGWWLFVFLHQPFETVERWPFVVLCEILFSVVVVLMLSAGFRVSQIWSRFRRLLQELERSPECYVFSRLKGFSWTPIWRQGGENAEWVNMARSLEALRLLGNGESASEPNVLVMNSLKHQIQTIQVEIAHLTALRHSVGVALPAPPAVADLHLAVTDLRARLKFAFTSPLLEAAIEECCSKIDTLEKLRDLEHSELLIESTLVDLQSLLEAGLAVLRLLAARASAQDTVSGVKGLIKDLRNQREFLPAVGGIFQYREALEQPAKQYLAVLFHRFGKDFREVQVSFAAVLDAALDVLHRWGSRFPRPLDDGEAEIDDKGNTPHLHAASVEARPRNLQHIEEYVALRYVAFIRGVLEHIRNSLLFLAISFSLALTSLNIYSFEPHQSLIWSFTGIFIMIAFSAVIMLMQIHRDHILSRITGTKPNELGIAFYVRTAAFGAVPALTLLATYFPSIGNYLLNFLQPGLQALK